MAAAIIELEKLCLKSETNGFTVEIYVTDDVKRRISEGGNDIFISG